MNTLDEGKEKQMATSTIRLDDGVREETTRIASQMGLSFNAVMNIMARKFNEVKGFPFPVRLETAEKTVFDLSSDDFEQACRKAVAERDDTVPVTDYITRFDLETGKVVKVYADGRKEYVL
jgi:antitoxin component of RelBE/YafQ-DinJ toxin-antitoxin module